MNSVTDPEIHFAAFDAAFPALTRAKDSVLGAVETLRADFSRIEHYKDIPPCVKAFNKTERALREAFDMIYDAQETLLHARDTHSVRP